MSSSVRAVVFDFDGVILESADVKTEAFCELYAEHGPDVVARVRAHHLDNLGISRFKKFAWIADNILRSPLAADDSARLGEQFSKLALAKVLAAPFVEGALVALRTLAKRYPLFIASGTPQSELELIVERRDLRHLFREVHGTPREKPAILTDICERFQFAPHEVLFIGDGSSDHEAAIATRVAFLARDTPSFHDRWISHGVSRRPDLSDLPAVVEAWR